MFSFARACGALLVLAPLAAVSAQGTAAQKVVAYVDSRYLVNGAPATPSAQAVLQRDVQSMEAQVKRMSDSMDVLTAAFTKDQATLSADRRDARIKVINDRQNEYQQRYQALQAQAQDREAEVMQPILDQIKLAIEDVRVELGYAVILDIGQNAAIVAADKNLNISDRVLAKLRTMPVPVIAGASGAGKADPKAAPAGGKAPAPTGGPVQGAAGIRPPGSAATPPATKRPDSTSKADSAAAKAKADSAARKKTDTLSVTQPRTR